MGKSGNNVMFRLRIITLVMDVVVIKLRHHGVTEERRDDWNESI